MVGIRSHVVFLVEIGIPIGYVMKSASGGQKAPQK